MAMCSDVPRSQQLVTKFTAAFPYWAHLHFWIAGTAVRELMGTDGATFEQYMALFSQLPAAPSERSISSPGAGCSRALGSSSSPLSAESSRRDEGSSSAQEAEGRASGQVQVHS
jgi:hypothetical protein